MSSAWLVRPKPHGKERMDEFLKGNIVAIGWPGIGDLKCKSREEIKELLQDEPYYYTSLELGNAYATVDLFVNQIEKGDLVVIPNRDDIYFAKVVSDYQYDQGKDCEDEGYPHQRKVEFLNGPILRTQLTPDLRKGLKVHRTTANLARYYDVIKALAYNEPAVEVEELEDDSEQFMELEYPIRPGIMAKVSIPQDITQLEASRLGDFIKTIYFK